MKASLILVTYNNFDVMYNAISSIYNHTTVPYHLYIVDNNSSDNTLGLYGSNLPNTTVIRNNENKWWCGGINQGIKLSDDSDYVFFLNDDIEVGRNWDINHINALNANSTIGAVGPLNSNSRDWQGIDNVRKRFELDFIDQVPTQDKSDIDSINSCLQTLNQSPVTITGMLAFFCTAFRRDVINKVGLLDERYVMGGDDDQYCRRLDRAGYKLQLLLNTYVMHHGGSSLSKMDEGQKSTLQAHNLELLAKDFPEYYRKVSNRKN